MAKVTSTNDQLLRNFASEMARKLGKLTHTSIAALSKEILSRSFDKKLGSKHGAFRGPGGHPIKSDVEALYGTASATAKLILSMDPTVKYYTIEPRYRTALRFRWPAAPPKIEARAVKAGTWPFVFLARVRRAVIIPFEVSEDVETESMRIVAQTVIDKEILDALPDL